MILFSMKEPQELNEFQKKTIQKKLSMDFYKELDRQSKEKSKYSKTFRDHLDVLISDFDAKGIMFYGFTINLTYLSEQEYNIWEEVHADLEQWLNYMGCHIQLIEFCYMSIEVHGKKPIWWKKKKKKASVFKTEALDGLPHIHGIIGIRSLTGENSHIFSKLKEIFISNFHDTEIKWLRSPKNIKAYWNFVIKENNFKFHRFVNFSDFNQNMFGSIADEELKFEDQQAFGQANHFISETMEISGVLVKYPKPKTLVIYLLNLYLFHQKYKVHHNKIYQQIEGSFYSWKIIDSLEALSRNNIMIFEYLKKLYPQQLDLINTIDLVSDVWNKTVEDIFKNNNYLLELRFKEDALEFLDGIYFINEDKFLSFETQKNELDIKMKNKNSCVFFKTTYSNLQSPKTWIYSIMSVLNLEDFNSFCIDFAKLFHNSSLENIKKKTLVILGNINQGEKTLKANVIINLFGKEIIGMIGRDEVFAFKPLVDQGVLLADEYDRFECSFLLKTKVNQNKSLSKKCIYTNKTPLIFFLNSGQQNQFINQFFEIEEFNPKINDTLKEKLASIIIYCNKLYFDAKKKDNFISTTPDIIKSIKSNNDL